MRCEIRVRLLRREDVSKLTSWGTYTDLRYHHYNFPYRLPKEFEYWYRSKYKFLKKYIFAIERVHDKKLVGCITLKNIKWLKKEGEMGIVIDSNYVNEGYGTIAIKKYLSLVSQKFKLKKIILKVAIYNDRAIHVYQKIGFKVFKKTKEPFINEKVDKSVCKYPNIFMKNQEVYTEYIYMKMIITNKK